MNKIFLGIIIAVFGLQIRASQLSDRDAAFAKMMKQRLNEREKRDEQFSEKSSSKEPKGEPELHRANAFCCKAGNLSNGLCHVLLEQRKRLRGNDAPSAPRMKPLVSYQVLMPPIELPQTVASPCMQKIVDDVEIMKKISEGL